MSPRRFHPGFFSQTVAAAPSIVVVLVCCVCPLLWMLFALLANPSVRSEFSIDVFRAGLLGRTLGYNFAAALIATIMGLPAGHVLGRGRGWAARLLWLVIPAALILPSLAYAYGWSQVVRIVQPSLGWTGVSFRPSGPADTFRCIWSLGAWLWAIPALLLGLSLRQMDSSVQQQALLDGALYRVTLRQLAGPIIASVAIVTVLATHEFAVYEPTGISVVATEVRMVFDTGALSSPDNAIALVSPGGAGLHSPDQAARAAAAVATATPLLLATALLASIAAWGISQTSAAGGLAVGEWPPTLNASRVSLALTVFFVALNIGVPVAALLVSLRAPLSPTRIYAEFAPQVQGALIVAGEAVAVAIIAALSASARWTPGLLGIGGATFLVGGQLLAIALIRIYNRPGLEWAYNVSVVPVIAYLGRFGWLALAAGKGTWSRPWRELREVAALDGAGTLRTASAVVWPLAWPMLLAGGLLVGALSLTEVPATVLLLPQNPQVLTPTLMTWVHMTRYDPMIEASLLMMAGVLVPALAAVGLAALGLKTVRLGFRSPERIEKRMTEAGNQTRKGSRS